MNDVVRTAYVPTLTVATASLLTAGMHGAFSGDERGLLLWAVALVAAVALFLGAGRPDSSASTAAAVVAMLATAALWGALDGSAATSLAAGATVLYLALAVASSMERASASRAVAD